MLKKVTLLTIVTIMLGMSSAAWAGVREDWETVADAIASIGQEDAAARIREAVNALSDAELEGVYAGANLAGLAVSFEFSGEAMYSADQAIREAQEKISPVAAFGNKSVGLPGAVGYPTTPLCPFSPNRSNADALLVAVDAIAAARVALDSAKTIWSGLSRACSETIVILGEGGNSELACIPVDIALFVAEAIVGSAESVVENLIFCDNAVDSAEIEGSYERAGHIHSDLTDHDADIKAQLDVHDTDIKVQLDVHDTDIKVQLATHDADVKALLANIQGTVDENQRLIKIFMSRQLEVMRLLITPAGQRAVNTDVLICTGDDCPQAFECQGGGFGWPCK